MSKYYLWSANKNGRFKYESVLTGSNSFTDGSTSINGTKEAYSTVVSPDGEKLFRFARHGNGAQYTGSYFAIHQSQSSIPGGFHFGAGKSSDSVVFSSFLTNNYNNANSDNPGVTAAWLSNTEIAVMVPYVYSYGLMNNHTLTGAGFPSEIANNSGASGLFMILTGSGASWEVAFWHTGSSQLQIADAPDGQATQMWQYDMVVPNHRYTTTETDLILVGATSNYNTTPGSDNRATVFKKTAGSWGFHSNFYYDGQTTRQTNNAIRYANFLGDDQDLIGISYSDSKASNIFAIFEPSGSSGNTRHSRISSTLSPWNHFAWDPYESKFLGNLNNLLMVIPSSSNWTDNVLGDAATQNAASEIEVQLANSSLPEFPSAGNTGKEMLKWKFSSGYTGIVYGGFFGWSQLLYLESGSYGWLGVGHNSNSRQQYYEAYYEVINGDKTDWQGGADIFGAEGNSNNLNKILVGAYKRNAQLTWDWNTTKGGTGDVLFSLEGKGTGTFDEQQSTGRSVFLNFRAYSGVTPDEWVPISSDTTGSTTYQASSSVASGLTYASHATGMESELTQNHSYAPRGGKFSPDGTKLAMATMYVGNGVGRTTSDYQSGVDIWESGSSGWSFLTGAACHLRPSSPVADVVWLSDSQIVALQSTSNVLMPITWTSSSSGWDAESSYLLDYNSDVTDEDSNAKTNLRSATKILLNEDKKAFVIYNASNGAWGSFVSSSAGTNGFVGYAHVTEGMNNFVWASSSHDNRYRLIGRADDAAHFSIGLIDKTTGRDTGGALRENINKFEFSTSTSANFANFMFYHSGSDSLIFTDLNNLVVEHKLTPFGTDLGYDNGTSTYPSGTYHPHWMGQSTAETPEARTQPYFLNADYHPTVGFPISSSVGRGRFDDADDSSQANGAPFPNGKIINDPNSADRFFVSKDHENSTNPFKLKVLERGSSGWKMTNVFSTSSNLYTENASVRQQTEFDFSSRGDLVIPHATANTGFSIARLVDPPPANPPLNGSVTEAIDSSGGTVSAGGTQNDPAASVTFPENALTASTNITVDVTSEDANPATNGIRVAAGPDTEAYSPVIEVTPHGKQFRSAVTLTFDLSGSVAGTCPADLKVYKSNDDTGVWYELPSSLWSCSDGTITISTTSFSRIQAVGGTNTMARTQLRNFQIRKLTDANMVLGGAIDITGSADTKSSIAATDKFLVQASSGISQQIAASTMQSFFSSVDLVEASGSTRHAMVMAVSGSTDNATLYVDAGIEYLPSTEEFFIHGDMTVEGGKVTLSNGATIDSETAGELKLTEDQISIIGALSGSGAAQLGSTLAVAGVATFAADVTASAGLHINGGAVANSMIVEDLTDNRIVIAGTGGELEDSASLTFDGSTLAADAAISGSGALSAGGALDIAGAAAIGDKLTVEANGMAVTGAVGMSSTLDVAGVATFAADVTASAGLQVAQEADLNGSLDVAGIATFAADVTASAGLQVAQEADLNGSLDVAGIATFAADVTASAGLQVAQEADLNGALTVAGVAQFASDITASAGLHIDGGAVANSMIVEDLTDNRVVFAGTGGELEDSAGLTFDGTSLAVSSSGGIDLNQGDLEVAAGNISGSANLSAGGQLIVAGASDLNGGLNVEGAVVMQSTIQVASNADLNGELDVAGNANFQTHITGAADLQLAGSGSIAGDLTISGNLTVAGSTTTVNTEEVTIADHNIVLDSNNSLTDVVSGAGITLEGGSGDDITFQYDGSEEMELKKGSSFYKLHIGDLVAADSSVSALSASSAAVADLTATRVVFAAAGGELVDSANMTFDGSALSASAMSSSFFGDGSGLTGVKPRSEDTSNDDTYYLTFVSASGFTAGVNDATDFYVDSGSVTFNPSSGLMSIPSLQTSAGADIDGTLNIQGVATFQADITASAGMHIAQELHVDGVLQADGAADLNSTLNVQDVATFQADITASAGLHVDAGAEINSLKVEDLTSGRIVLAGTGGEIEDSANLAFNGSQLSVTGIISGSGNLQAGGQLDVAGVASFASDITASAGMHIAQEIHVDGAADLDGTLDVAGAVTLANASVTFSALADLDESSVSSADKFIIQDADASGVAKEITLEDVADYMVNSGSTNGIQAAAGRLSIDYIEDLYMSASMTAGLTASLSAEPLAESLHVYLNGMLQIKSSSAGNTAGQYDFRIAGSGASQSVVFAQALDADDVVQLKYIKK